MRDFGLFVEDPALSLVARLVGFLGATVAAADLVLDLGFDFGGCLEGLILGGEEEILDLEAGWLLGVSEDCESWLGGPGPAGRQACGSLGASA